MMQQPIGSVGALPVFASVADVPAWVVQRGVAFVLPDLGVYQAAPPDGLSGWLSTVIQIGGLVAAPFTGGLSIPASQVAGGLVAQREAQGAQERQIGASFDQLAAQTTQLFNSIQAKAVITAADYSAAANAYNQLASIAEQYSPSISFVARQWNSPAYKQAYLARLEQIQAAAQATATGGASTSTGGTSTTSADGSATVGLQPAISDNTKLYLGAAAVALAVLVMTR